MSEQHANETASHSVRQRLMDWFARAPGAELFEMEIRALNRVLPGLFGYHLVQLGNTLQQSVFSASRISHRVLVQLQDDARLEVVAPQLVSSDESLPFQSDSVDVMLLPHVLEYAENPHKVLREVERVLIGDGHLILLGFNPWSLFGLWRLCLVWREEPPWCGHFYGLARVKDWLSLLDFEIVRVQRFFYRPPLRSKTWMRRFSFQEKLGKYCWPYLGGVYLIVAKKRVIPLTPIRLRWHSKRRMIASGVTEPSARSRS